MDKRHQQGTRRRNKIDGQFAPRTLEMLESPAYRVLSLSAHRVLARLELELGSHGGRDNGRLPTTFDDFERYGVHRHAIAPAIREVEALGFVAITERGRSGNAEWRRPHLFRLTYRNTNSGVATNEWKRFGRIQDADAAARKARYQAPEKQKSSGGNRTAPVVAETAPLVSAETTTTVHSAETTTTIDISGGGTPSSPRRGRVANGAAAAA